MATQTRIFRRNDEACPVEVFLHGDQIELHGEDGGRSWKFLLRDEDRLELETANGPIRGRFWRDGDTLWLHADGRSFCLEIEIPGRSRGRGAAAVRDEVLAPMTGTVQKVHVAIGDPVTAGDPVVVLEAMKMEHVLKAPRDGIVATVLCRAGEQAEAQSVLIRLEEVES